MKKLCRSGAVHPTPPAVSDQLISFFPAAILTLAAALSPEEKEVLAYLISCSSANFSNTHLSKTFSASGSSKGVTAAVDHPPCFNCYCFCCYTGYWVKWDSSPNRQLIHEIIDAFEEIDRKKEKGKKERKKTRIIKRNIVLELQEPRKSEPSLTHQDIDLPCSNSKPENDTTGAGGKVEENGEEEVVEKGLIRRFMSFLGDRIWGHWG